MSSSIPPDDESTNAHPTTSPEFAKAASDDLLPPVEPPSAGFIVQLFVVPAVIVTAVVLLWVLINWVVHRGADDPEQVVRALASSNQARFQKVNELANMLRMPTRYHLNSRQDYCQPLAEKLSEMIDAGDAAESEVTMRFILTRMLGMFHIDDGLDVLIKAVREDPERDVRRQAVNAIAVLGQTFVERKPPEAIEHPKLLDTLIAVANQRDDELLRSEAAFTMGVLVQAPDADPRLVDQLALLAEDFYPDARYNAATGLARIGDQRAAENLAEMLDLEVIEASVQSEKKFSEQVSDASLARQRAEKRDLILKNAITGVDSLLDHNDPRQLAALKTALQAFIDDASATTEPWPIPGSIVERASQVLQRFDAKS